jgi:hypothetical protein
VWLEIERAPEPGAATVVMLDEKAVRDEFFALTVVDGTPEQKRKAKSMRFHRAIERAETNGLIGRREIEGTACMWFTDSSY